ncbi:putative ABC transport system permease protein [Rhodothalassium salexigens DSM 2132]|uniref:Putative ABC transport system permease protein n=1 Tax=Rhodothalassium salexigens DSM 2132 TaxID=1188247 RepID=A0A4R2PAT6_RHOSA|nr:FtsX-like permease family protein [Rhodothalassium salexigens]MBB4212460.1 putative ABC transport system permease protein [Rhodothalassium salexigens DSM 2132]MBK1639550.1 hypothetical protein [Rhodothalassium salexigens DSM 2132]TCP31498.1 putative ABC transport system permease protein [Rhodothalassium salexigens DSM 2132]
MARSPVLALARRELRGGTRGFRVFLGCLILGVAAIAGVGSLSRAVTDGLDAEGARLLAGDLEVRTTRQPLDPEVVARLDAMGAVARVARMSSNARAPATGRASVVEIKAPGAGYPFYGGLATEPDRPLAALLGQRDGAWGAVADRVLAERLGIDLGDRIAIGGETVVLRGYLRAEPDRANQGWQLGPTLMVAPDLLDRTGLLGLGSLVRYYYKVKLPSGADLDAAKARLTDAYPDARWSVRDRTEAAPGIRGFVERFATFLTLVGLTALLVGGVGVSNAVRTYLDAKTETIATFKVLGADGATIFALYLGQVLALALVAVAAGLALGAALPFALQGPLAARLPVPPAVGLYPAPLATAALYGLLIAVAFSIWPLGQARDISAGGLFRDAVAGGRRWPRRRYVAAAGLAMALVAGAAVGLSTLPVVAAVFIAAAVVALGLLRLTGAAVERLARALPRPRRPHWRLALANLHRPGAATGPVVMSLGLGLTLFATLAAVEGNLRAQINQGVPERAPAFYFLDIQPGQRQGFEDVAGAVEGVTTVATTPYVGATIVALDGVPAAEADVAPGGRWLLQGDKRMSYAARLPDGNRIAAGQWWGPDYDGPPAISIDRDNARALGLDVGDTVTLNVMGRTMALTVMSHRLIDWSDFGFNFIFLIDPKTLEGAPHPYIGRVETASRGADERVYQAIVDAYPAVTAVPIGDIVDTVSSLLGQMAFAVRAVALITVVAGVLVLAGAIAAGHRKRVYDAAVLKVVGARRRDVLAAFVIEYLLLGAVTAAIALALGSLAGWLVVTEVMALDFTARPLAMVATVAASLGLTLAMGLAGSWAALGVRPARLLRAA